MNASGGRYRARPELDLPTAERTVTEMTPRMQITPLAANRRDGTGKA